MQSNALLVLGSATPDIKTFHAARRSVESGGPSMAWLPERVGGGTLPGVELVDIRSQAAAGSLLAPRSLGALKEVVGRGEQAVILLNRRGYAPNMYCLECCTTARCSHCEIAMTFHKARERLLCHYCGHSLAFPCICANCRCSHFLPMGEGTEKLEESLGSILPKGSRVLRLDRDSTRRPGRLEEILEAFALQQAQVLVGTQMLSKGHHFPNVTLSIIADADLGLNLPDYRASERTFQLLVQSAGRAGRGDKAGHVLIQTRDVGHYCWKYVLSADYEGFYEHELGMRQRRNYPPFVKLALARISIAMAWKESHGQLKALGEASRLAARSQNVQVLGPVPAPMPLLRGRRRFQCLFKGADWAAIRSVYAAMARVADSRHTRIRLDIDPVSML
jgi:primosomal protein N' (replication factor Y)